MRDKDWNEPCEACLGYEGQMGPDGDIMPFPCTCHPARKELERLKAKVARLETLREEDRRVLYREYYARAKRGNGR